MSAGLLSDRAREKEMDQEITKKDKKEINLAYGNLVNNCNQTAYRAI